MQHFVIDTSVLVWAFSENPLKERVDRLLHEVALDKIKLYAPTLLWYEFYSVMIKTKPNVQEALEAMQRFENFIEDEVIEICEKEITKEALTIAYNQETGKQGYIHPNDSYFHALALHLNCPFLTNDEKHYNKTKDTIRNIMMFSDLELPALP
ncbi:MAG: type II toxin-antitoxin system VapC family toxin [Bacteroidota bacterium]